MKKRTWIRRIVTPLRNVAEIDTKYNYNILVVGNVGSGKTTCIEWMVENYLRDGCVVIWAIDYKAKLEGAYCGFKPKRQFHLNDLYRNNQEPKKYPIKLYHFFTYDIPNKYIPEFNFYTISLKSLGDEEIKFLLEDERETAKYKLMYNTLIRLKKDDGIFNYLMNMRNATKKQQKEIGDKVVYTDIFEGSASGNVVDFNEVNSLLQPFIQNHHCLMPKSCEYNLNIREILKDNQHVHIFSNRYVNHPEKVKDFNSFWLLNQIYRNIDYTNKKVVVILDEIKELFPKKPRGYKMIFKKVFKKSLTELRASNVTFISGTQIYSQTDDEISNMFTELLIGRNKSLSDLKAFGESGKIRKHIIDNLKGLDIGEFYYVGMEHFRPIQFPLPPFMHKEETYKFEKIYSKHFPDKMKNYSSFVGEIKKKENEVFEELKKKVRERHKRVEEKELMKQKRRERKEKDKEKIEELQETVQTKQKSDKIKRDSLILELHNQGNSFRQISKVLTERYNLKVTHQTVKNVIDKLNNEKKSVYQDSGMEVSQEEPKDI